MLSLFLPITFLVYFQYPSTVNPNILLSLPPGAVASAGKICMAIHTILAFLIIINPVSQDFEELVGIKKGTAVFRRHNRPSLFNRLLCVSEFGIGRLCTRTFVMVLVVLCGETIPKFSYMLDIIGGSMLPILSLVLPSIFYLRLTSDKLKAQFVDDQW